MSGSVPDYVELVSTSNFSFLRGGSHPEELAVAAAGLGLTGFGLTDRNSFAGVVRAYVALRDMEQRPPAGFRYLVGTRLCFADGTPDIVAYPTDRDAYGRLCKLLSIGNLRKESEKGNSRLYFGDLAPGLSADTVVDLQAEDFTTGQLFILVPDETDWERSEAVLATLSRKARGRVWIAGSCRFGGTDRARLRRIADIGRRCGIPMLATNDVLYHEPGRRVLQDVVTCIREHITIEDAGRRLEPNAERHIKTPAEMARLFREHPEAIAETARFAARIGFSLDQLKYNYPTEKIGNETTQETLERLTWEGAGRRYKNDIPQQVIEQLKEEFTLIADKGYAPYFLTVHDIVMHARYQLEILCQGRGSAANSVVCFCLEITEVNPTKVDLVFGRFLSTERDEPPDIDVDFEHERREEVMQYVYKKYGGNHTGLTANVICYRSRAALREVAKVFGLSDDTIDAINQMHWGWDSSVATNDVKVLGLDASEPILAMVLECAGELRGFPRHLSQHVGGFVITRDELDRLVPIGKSAMETRSIIEWNKDDIDALGILKIDVLALGMLTCLKRAFGLMRDCYGRRISMTELQAEAHDAPAIAKPVFEMTHRADTIGVFQIESRAQMSMLPRLKPDNFYDFVIEVAIVRPGPIQGGMVHPYLKRRLGQEKVVYPSKELERVLHKTLGVPLFQEQAMQIAVKGAGFSPGEADRLRRSMATFKRTGGVTAFRDKFISGMLAKNYPREFAESCFKQIEGFGSYGFPESHAASFALLVYVSCWLKCHYPDVFLTALLNSQPMGFYAPAQLIRDAIEHGVEVRPVDINRSGYETLLEEGSASGPRVWGRHRAMRDQIWSDKAVRLGLNQISGLKEAHANLLIGERGSGYGSVRDLYVRTAIPIATLEKLAEADAFQSLGLNRRKALWAVRGLKGSDGAQSLELFRQADRPVVLADADPLLPLMAHSENVIHDYKTLSFSLKGHPMSFMRGSLDRRGTVACADLEHHGNGDRVTVAGLVLVRQRPGTASGIVFATLEDETGIANIVIWNKVFEANRRTILASRAMAVRGRLQVEGLVIHVVAESFIDLTADLVALAKGHDLGDRVLARADEGTLDRTPAYDVPRLRQEEAAQRQARAALPRGRNFK
ncbi:MAG TPA: error-prone DNA polymerase [Devosia sp.]|nr:error-prone DNA polymerase [Devosia sp.]